MSLSSLGLLLAGLAVALILRAVESRAFRRRLRAAFGDRPCAGLRRRRRFPNASKQAIRDFLRVVAGVFALPDECRSRLRPTDRVIELYRLLYPQNSWFAVDAMELETLALELEENVGRTLDELSPTTTLADLFDWATAPLPPRARPSEPRSPER